MDFGSVVSQLLNIVIQLAVLGLFYALVLLRKKAEEYLAAHLNSKQLEIAQLIGREAFAFAETAYRELSGPDKLSAALDYFEKRAAAKGIPFDAEAARAAIEKAWLEAQAAQASKNTPAK